MRNYISDSQINPEPQWTNGTQITPEQAARSLHPSADWYAAQVLFAFNDWEANFPGFLDKNFPGMDALAVMTKICQAFDDWF
jgi:hypothetical protein